MDEQQEQQQQDEASVCLDYGEEDVISMEKEDSKFDLKSAGFQLAHLNPLSPPLLTRTNMNTICVCLVGLCFRMQTLKGGKFDATLLAVGEVPIAFLDALVPHSEASTEAGERDTSKIRVTGHPPLRVEVSLLPVSIAEARGSLSSCAFLKPCLAAGFSSLPLHAFYPAIHGHVLWQPVKFDVEFEAKGGVMLCKCKGILRAEDAKPLVNMVCVCVCVCLCLCLCVSVRVDIHLYLCACLSVCVHRGSLTILLLSPTTCVQVMSHAPANRFVCLTEAPLTSYLSSEPANADPLLRSVVLLHVCRARLHASFLPPPTPSTRMCSLLHSFLLQISQNR